MREYQSGPERYQITCAVAEDDSGLRELMTAHMAIDALWPPEYARDSDLADWLRADAVHGRWVARSSSDSVCAHVGLGPVSAGAHRDALTDTLGCEASDLAEIRRLVIHPDCRGHGLAGEMTRVALRGAIESGLFPVSNVVSSRGSWLDMMLATGWQEVGRIPSRKSRGDIVSMLAPAKFVDVVRQKRS